MVESEEEEAEEEEGNLCVCEDDLCVHRCGVQYTCGYRERSMCVYEFA